MSRRLSSALTSCLIYGFDIYNDLTALLAIEICYQPYNMTNMSSSPIIETNINKTIAYFILPTEKNNQMCFIV